MRRIVLAALMTIVLAAVPVLAQRSGHMIALPDQLEWGDHGVGPTDVAFVNAAGDPRKK